MTSKNMMNHFGPPRARLTLKPLISQELPCSITPIGFPLILALDVMVRLRGRRLGDIDRVRSWKGLLQPFLQRLVEAALLAVFGVGGLGARCDHGCVLWIPVERCCKRLKHDR